MKIEITFNCDNEAFSEPDSPEFADEVSTVLRQCEEKFKQGYARFPIRDSNGNTIGTAGLISGD